MNIPWLEPVWNSLAATLEHGRLGHGLLIHGPAGLGKRELAHRLATRLLCQQPAMDACGQCMSCRLMATVPEAAEEAERAPMAGDTHPDLATLAPGDRAAAQIKVDDIRALNHRIMLTPSLSPHRAARILSAGRMNVNAANALLKTLEEPPPGAWLILVSDRPAALPATIRSRCVQVAVYPPERSMALEWLQAASNADAQSAQQVLDLAGGAPQVALEWLTSGGLDFGESVLQELINPKNEPLQLAEEWAKSADAAWRWLARWCQLALKLRLTGQGGGQETLTRLARAPAGLLQERYAAACEGLRLTTTQVRQDLLLAQWLTRWNQGRGA